MPVGKLEARVGIEPTHKGFADLSLTTWVPRLGWSVYRKLARSGVSKSVRLSRTLHRLKTMLQLAPLA
jgi:hypothetical protein